LWRRVFKDYEPNAAEIQILYELARVLDEIDVLSAVLAQSEPIVQGSTGQPRINPLYGELREHRKLADQLTLSLALPAEGEQVGRRVSGSARAAAESRWRRAIKDDA
jgi:hypothetical protein